MVRWWTAKDAKEKNFWTYLAILKLAPSTVLRLGSKEKKKKKDFQRVFDNPLAK